MGYYYGSKIIKNSIFVKIVKSNLQYDKKLIASPVHWSSCQNYLSSCKHELSASRLLSGLEPTIIKFYIIP